MAKKEEIYSKIDQIKVYQGEDTIVDGTLVLEGGAFRGLYTAGVLDCLIDNGINIKNAIGISAGALNAVNYLAGARGRTAICILKHRFNPRYVGLKAYLESKSVVGFKFMFEDLNEELVLDEERVLNSFRELYVGATNLESGICEFFNPKDKDLLYKSVQASASMPIVSQSVEINGKKYLDGGCETKLPIKFALNNDFKKIIFIGTRPINYRRKLVSGEQKVENLMYKNYPNFLNALENANKRYNFDAEFLEELSNRKTILTICPSERVAVSRLESDIEKLGDLYMLGFEDCKKRIPEIKKYLGI